MNINKYSYLLYEAAYRVSHICVFNKSLIVQVPRLLLPVEGDPVVKAPHLSPHHLPHEHVFEPRRAQDWASPRVQGEPNLFQVRPKRAIQNSCNRRYMTIVASVSNR